MTGLEQIARRETLTRIRSDYAGEGSALLISPAGVEVPQFLRQYVPDAIVKRPDGGIVIGIKPVPPTDEDDRRLELLAREVQRHPGWKFQMCLAQPRQELLDAQFEPGKSDILNEIETGRHILNKYGPKAALLYSWGLLEAAARKVLASETGRPRKRIPAAALPALLVSEGLADDESGRELGKIAAIRNQVAHGFVKVEVSQEDLEFLLGFIETLAHEITQE